MDWPWEYLHHGIVPAVGVVLAPVEHVGAVGKEHAAKESVNRVHLQCLKKLNLSFPGSFWENDSNKFKIWSWSWISHIY